MSGYDEEINKINIFGNSSPPGEMLYSLPGGATSFDNELALIQARADINRLKAASAERIAAMQVEQAQLESINQELNAFTEMVAGGASKEFAGKIRELLKKSNRDNETRFFDSLQKTLNGGEGTLE